MRVVGLILINHGIIPGETTVIGKITAPLSRLLGAKDIIGGGSVRMPGLVAGSNFKTSLLNFT